MRLPRRVPWAAIAELDQLCSWIFADENDMESKVLAINRLSAWRAITYLPHALESALGLLVVIIQDNAVHPQTPCLALRQSYAAAIIRLVNGLVDPLQLGAYARSIASIASQLGLPPWLVELRHAATHEDLPSLELLREAAHESMSWLLHNYFLPTINPSSAAQAQPVPMRSVAPLLKHYKGLLKITTRDASLRSQYKADIASVLRDIERWISEAKVAANVAVGQFGWDTHGTSESRGTGEQDIREKWALERLCDGLLEKGALVPLSKKKRTFPPDSFTPPRFSVQLWTPVLEHVQSLHPDFPSVLSRRIVSYLVTDIQPPRVNAGQIVLPDTQPDPSFDMCLARWAMWALETWDVEDSESEVDLRKEVTMSIIHAFGPGSDDSTKDRKAATALLQALGTGDTALQAATSVLLQPPTDVSTTDWNPDDIAVMNQRLNALLSLLDATPNASRAQTPTPDTGRISNDSDMIVPGWRLLDERSNWKPCPIGIYTTA